MVARAMPWQGLKVSVGGPAAVDLARLKIGQTVKLYLGDGGAQVEPHPDGAFEVVDLATIHDTRAAGALREVELRLRRVTREG